MKLSRIRIFNCIGLLCLGLMPAKSGLAAEIFEAVPLGATWKYLDDGSNQGTAWQAPGFNDSGWASGPAELGYGDGDEATEVGFGPDSANKYTTTYFRHAFDVPEDVSFSNLQLRLVRDDGAVVYLNGVEVFRSNMPAGAIAFDTVSANSVSAPEESAFFDASLSSFSLLPGNNVLAVEVHQWTAGSSDISFNLQLTAEFEAPPGTPPSIIAQPSSRSVGVAEGAVFSVSVFGSQPLQYQWRFNGDPILNGTNASYSIPSASFDDAGSYDVLVSNPFGSETSNPATLDVIFLNEAQTTYEPLGPTTRRTGLVFSEIMYHPRERSDGRELEFIEIYNTNPYFEDLSGYRLSSEVDYTFPEGTIIEGQSFVVVAASPADLEAVYGLSGVMGPWSSNKLSNSSARIRLRKKSDAIVLETEYTDEAPWPVAADGAGHSMIQARASFGEYNPQSWAASASVGGSPGVMDPIPTGPLEHIVINELLAHTDLPEVDFIELFNASPLPVDISGCFLSDDSSTNKFRISEGTLLGAGQFISYTETELGFALSAEGETIYLVNPAQTRVLDVIRFEGQANGVGFGRFPDGGPRWQTLENPTADQANAAPLVSDIVINEIMYSPFSGDDDDEYVELFNKGGSTVDVGGWKFTHGIDYTIPTGTSLAAGGYLVVARDAARLLTNHPGLSGSVVVGDFGGRLSNRGERLALARPDTIVGTNDFDGGLITNRFYVVIDEVTYKDGGRWGKWSDGGGSSLELTDAHSDNGLASNWADSDESAKSEWVTVEKSDVTNLNHPAVASIDQLHFFLLDAGEALVDDVELVYNGANRVSNAGYESGLTGWFFQGTQRPSYLETGEGFSGSSSLHLVASARGGVANRVRTQLTLAVPVNSPAVIRAKVRWLRGHSEIVFRAVGSSIEAVGSLPVPANLGTPGAANSQRVPNAGPAIFDVVHNPALPRAGESIRVTARVQDPDGLSNVLLRYRIDPSGTLTTVVMNDDGINGDLLEGDGVYSGIVPGQPAGDLVAFRVQATDGAGPAVTAQFPKDAPTQECLVRIGESDPVSDFGTYHIWITDASFDFWDNRENSSNEDVDATFVYGNSRVVYNVGIHYGASDNYTTILNNPTGTLVGYNLEFPSDDRLLGARGVRLDWPVRDPTFVREHLMYWFLEQYGLPNNYRRFINFYINGSKRGSIYEDTQRPNGDMIEEWYGNDAGGHLYKTDGWFEANTDGVFNAGVWLKPLLQFFNDSQGNKKLAYYRFNWKPRNTDRTANDYSPVFDMIDAANVNGPTYEQNLEQVIDMENWMRTFAMNDLASFWDSFGNPNSKNAYVYKPQRSGWKIMPWDFDVGLGVFNDPPDYPLFAGGVDPVIVRMFNTPAFVRHYWAAIEEALDNFFDATSVTPFMQERYDALRANGISSTSPFVPSGPYNLSVPGWITQRRAFLVNQLTSVAAAFAVNGPDLLTTSENLLVLSGSAPVGVAAITVNGQTYPVTWETVNQWVMQVPLSVGLNVLNIQGVNRLGEPVVGAGRTISADYTGAGALPEQHLVITEIMYDPMVADAEFVELHNTSPTLSFDLSGWRLNGIDYTFYAGAIITNGQHLVLVKNRAAFASVYGADIPVYDEFDGSLDNGGETLTLFRPDPGAGADLVVDRVAYDDDLPWPQVRGGNLSIQLIDPDQDNSRAGNWSAQVVGEGWKQFSITQALAGSASSVLFNLEQAGVVFVDDVQLVLGTEPGVGPNLLANGDFEGGTISPWVGLGNHDGTLASSETTFSGAYSMKIIATGPGTSQNVVRQSVAGLVSGNTYSFSFKYFSAEPNRLRWRINTFYSDFVEGLDVTPVPPILATPAAVNSNDRSLPAFDPIWLNELVSENLTGITDNFGDSDPWVELYHGGESGLDLSGYYLANNFTNLTQWAFPAGSLVAANDFRLVWADAEPGETTLDQWHANFQLSPGSGVVALSRMVEGSPQVVDYMSYTGLEIDQGYGSFPDGDSFARQVLYFVTPGGGNDPSFPPAPLFINEWMASNTGSVLDPADFDPDDWFEIYNAGSETVDLAGYWLTDNPLIRNKYVIPAGFEIPGGGYLTFWADEEGGQTSLTAGLHVNFKLSSSGETIILSNPYGQVVDAVVFGIQSANISQGRFPDGGSEPFFSMSIWTPGAPNQVAPPSEPELENIQLDLSSGTATLIWNAEPGQTYRVQYKNNLDDGDWLDVPGGDVTVGLKVDPTVAGVGQRFYRVMVLP